MFYKHHSSSRSTSILRRIDSVDSTGRGFGIIPADLKPRYRLLLTVERKTFALNLLEAHIILRTIIKMSFCRL